MIPPLDSYTLGVLIAAAAVMGLGGFVKGAVGFALPMVALSGLGLFLTAQDALALILIPSALTNIWQMLRQGTGAARETLVRFWRLNAAMALVLGFSAQIVPQIPSDALFLGLGVAITGAALLQLSGVRPGAAAAAWLSRHELGVGAFAGLVGGLTGVWGPPVQFYLMALDTDKTTQIRMLGINFCIGWTLLSGAHLVSGVLNPVTLPVSILMIVPVVAGMAAGVAVQDRLDPVLFRRVTLAVLCLAGLNLLRRGLF